MTIQSIITCVMSQEFLKINGSEHYDSLINEIIPTPKFLVTLKFANFLECSNSYHIVNYRNEQLSTLKICIITNFKFS